MKPTNADLKTKYAGLLHAPLAVHDVIHCNHKPHPYMVGTKHVVEASDHHCGMLTEEVCRRIRCAHPRCTTDYEGHTSDRVLVMKLTRSASQEEVKAQLTPELGERMTSDSLDGLVFLKQEAFTITKPEKINVVHMCMS